MESSAVYGSGGGRSGISERETMSTETIAGCCIETYSGRDFNVLCPKPDDVCIEDIGHSLALQCRFSGHCSRFYSVAEHCVRCAELIARQGHGLQLQLYALLHDAAEAYIGDITTPMKSLLPAVRNIEHEIQLAILGAARLPEPNEDDLAIAKAADNILLMTEAAVLIESGGKNWNIDAEPDSSITITGWPPGLSEQKFLDRFHHLHQQLAEASKV